MKICTMSCILVASPDQQENEQNYYQTIIGIQGDFLFAETLDEARMLAAGGKGYLPMEASQNMPRPAPSCTVSPCCGGNSPFTESTALSGKRTIPVII